MGISKMQHPGIAGLDSIRWDDIGMVAAVAEFSSLRQAARAMKINASTLVRHMERLEKNLGTQIFERQPQGFVLNDAGKAVAGIARDMQRNFNGLREVASQDLTARGRVKIAITEGLGTFWVAPKLPQFAQEHPDILIDMDSSMELRNPIRNEADIAIQFRKPNNPDLIVARLCHVHLYPFASFGYIEKKGMPEIGVRSGGHKIVIQESEQISNAIITEFLRKSRFEASFAFVTNSSIAHLYAVERGLGIGGLPTFAMAMGARLIPIDVNLQHSMEVWISYRRDMRGLKRVAVVIDWLRKIFSPQRYPWFAAEFMHPADIMRIVNKNLDRNDIFDSRIIKDFISGHENISIGNFKRNVGRPRH
jgi:DNA-binding transcriptional LysR family regulator